MKAWEVVGSPAGATLETTEKMSKKTHGRPKSDKIWDPYGT